MEGGGGERERKVNSGARRFFKRRQREKRNVVHRDITFPTCVRAHIAFFEIKWKTSLNDVRRARDARERKTE